MVSNALSLILGVLFAFFNAELIAPFCIAYLPITLLLAFLVPRYRFLLLILSAYLWTGLHFHNAINLKLRYDFDNQTVLLSGVIADIPEVRSTSIKLLIKPDLIEGYQHSLPKLIRLSWYHNKQLPTAGERWQFLAKLRRPGGFQNPAGFDYERWLFVKGIGATGYVKFSTKNKRLESPDWWNINRLRSWIVLSIDRACPTCNSQGLIKALTIGYRADIDPAQRQILKDSGTAHLLAISGLHIGLISGLFYLLGRWLWRIYCYRFGYNQIEFSALLSLCAGLSYAALAGFGIPTVRALIMLSVVCLALKFRAQCNLLNTIATAIVIILIVDPLAIGSTSLWLSAGALLMINFVLYLLQDQQGWLRKLLLIQGLFSLIFIPIGIVLFGQVNSAGFLANIIAIPVISFVLLPLTLLASFFVSVNLPYADSLLMMVDKGLSLLINYLQWLLESGMAAFGTANIPLPLVLLSLVGLIILVMPKAMPGKKPAIMLVLLPIIWSPEKAPYGSFKMTVLDVGMGTSIVVRTRNHSLVYDYGPGNNQGFSAGSWVVKPFLQYHNILPPDLMVISHVDQDHSGGFRTFQLDYDPSRLMSGTPNKLKERLNLDSAIQSCHDITAWHWDGVGFEFLPLPKTSTMTDSNNRSCVLKIQGLDSVLLAGDIESKRENQLVESNPDRLKSDLLVVPHHGSLTSSSANFVRSVLPKAVIFTVGKNNRWGFPKPEIIDRYESIDSRIYRTDLHGAVSVYSDSTGFRVESLRQHRPRLWY